MFLFRFYAFIHKSSLGKLVSSVSIVERPLKTQERCSIYSGYISDSLCFNENT